MITAVNAAVAAQDASDAVLQQIGDEDNANSSAVTVAQLEAILPALTDINSSNEAAYQAYIADASHSFSSPATSQEVQAMITAVNAAVVAPLPSNITISDANLTVYIASIYDTAIDIQGVIDMGTTPDGLLVKIPYVVTGSPVTLPAFSKSFTIQSSSTDNNESGIVATFSWEEQTDLPVGSGIFNAHITIDDSMGDADNIFKAKRLDIDDNTTGFTAATFHYATDETNGTGLLALKVIPGVPDREFGKTDLAGVKSHNFLYLPITNPVTGRTWLNNNLGAAYASVDMADTYGSGCTFNLSQQATAKDDHCAYGSLFEWGRKADGHELVSYSSGTSGSGINDTTGTYSDAPEDALYITARSSPYDWRRNIDDTLWADESSANNVCPAGYRLPLNPDNADNAQNEWYMESLSWPSRDSTGALASDLKFTLGGYRTYGSGGAVKYLSNHGKYWTGSVRDDHALFAIIYSSHDASTNPNSYRATGMSVRCIKDQ